MVRIEGEDVWWKRLELSVSKCLFFLVGTWDLWPGVARAQAVQLGNPCRQWKNYNSRNFNA